MKNLAKDALLFAFLVCVYFAGRLSLLLMFNPNGEVPSAEWYLMSLRFDAMTAAFITLPTFALTVAGLFCGRGFRRAKFAYAVFAAFASIITAAVNVCFFYEYKSQFNYWIFGIFFDDLRAIAAAVWDAYPIVRISLLALAVLAALYAAFRTAFSKIDALPCRSVKLRYRIIAAAVCVPAMFFAMRGGRISGRPLQLRDTAVESSEFLNNLIPSSAYCIKSEIKKFAQSATSGGLANFRAKESDMPVFLRELYGAGAFEEALARTAKGSPLKTAPKRVFLIVGEGHSAWPTYDRFQKYGIMPHTRSLYGKSLFCPAALSSGGGTMASVSSLISGIPYTGLDVRGVYRANADCAAAAVLKRLGYSSTFFYAGQSTWMQLGEFAKFNGFDRIVGGESMGDLYGTVEWGIRDKDMFDCIIGRDIPEKSFNMILTVSNHPPFDVDLKAEGCPAKLDTENDVRLYHMWYADREIGRFARAILEKYPDSLVIVTGDHAARALPKGENMTYAEAAAVPIIFAGGPVEEAGLGGRKADGAQHLDIIATMVEMLAPKGFKYNAWGQNLLESPRRLPPMNPVCAQTAGGIKPFNSSDCPDSIKELARKYFALSYYYSQGRKYPH